MSILLVAYNSLFFAVPIIFCCFVTNLQLSYRRLSSMGFVQQILSNLNFLAKAHLDQGRLNKFIHFRFAKDITPLTNTKTILEYLEWPQLKPH